MNLKAISSITCTLGLVMALFLSIAAQVGGDRRPPTPPPANNPKPKPKPKPPASTTGNRSRARSNPPATRTPATSGMSAARRAAAIQSIRDNLVLIPAGSFEMGSMNGDADERRVHRVTIANGFYMGKYEVTQAQWQAVMGTTVQQQRDKADPTWSMRGEGGNYPMYYVSWNEAQEFVRQLNARNDGYVYRLPSEAEWEYACRAGTTGDYAGVLDAMAWYGNNSGRSYIDADAIWRTDQSNYATRIVNNGNQTHPVGGKQPNSFGLYDMHGNVWEWCEDWYHDSYAGAPGDGSAWLSGGEQKYRVLRGGSWGSSANYLRSANRGRDSPGYRSGIYGVGFRVAASPR